MSILASNSGGLNIDSKFSKELFTKVAENLKVFTDEDWELIKNTSEYKKVLIAVYVRTDKDNLVLMVDKDKFASISNIPPFIIESGVYANTLIDVGLLCGKTLIDKVFDFHSSEAMNRLVAFSTCYPVGAVETSKKYVLVYNVIISESLLRDSEISLKQGFYFCPIESLCLTDSLQKEISESLIIVKEGDTNE